MQFQKVEKKPQIRTTHNSPFSFSPLSSTLFLPLSLTLCLSRPSSELGPFAVILRHTPSNGARKGWNVRPQLPGCLDIDLWPKRGSWRKLKLPNVQTSFFDYSYRPFLVPDNLTWAPLQYGTLFFWQKWPENWHSSMQSTFWT